ncbi:MAG: hypothetical protein LBT69_01210 [Lactobacillales bacterium]|jgi:lipopolysaccharide biosynthesis glycosyltransferase|nr:hypothetical protein [Lactobacillales bacterium]
MDKVLNVLYQSDKNYGLVGATSILSLLENNKHFKKINIYYLTINFSEQLSEKIKAIERKYCNVKIVLINAQKYIEELKKMNVTSWHGRLVTWCKMLAINDLAIQEDRVLYINPHSIINGNLDELVDLDFEDNIMALTFDPIRRTYMKVIELDYSDRYFNCGLMLFNYAKWKKENIDEFVRSELRKKTYYYLADQDFCNIKFKNKIKLLSFRWYVFDTIYAYKNRKSFLIINDLLDKDYFYSYREQMEDYYSPKILYSTFRATGHPWECGNLSPSRFLWDKYQNLLGWSEESRPVVKKNISYYAYKFLPNTIIPFINKLLMDKLYNKVYKRKNSRK